VQAAATGVDLECKQLRLDAGHPALSYDKLCIATGGAPKVRLTLAAWRAFPVGVLPPPTERQAPTYCVPRLGAVGALPRATTCARHHRPRRCPVQELDVPGAAHPAVMTLRDGHSVQVCPA
jgi:hypothetical protein